MSLDKTYDIVKWFVVIKIDGEVSCQDKIWLQNNSFIYNKWQKGYTATNNERNILKAKQFCDDGKKREVKIAVNKAVMFFLSKDDYDALCNWSDCILDEPVIKNNLIIIDDNLQWHLSYKKIVAIIDYAIDQFTNATFTLCSNGNEIVDIKSLEKKARQRAFRVKRDGIIKYISMIKCLVR